MPGITEPMLTYLFTLMHVLSDLVWLLAIVDIITIFVLIFMERMDPRSFVAWLVIILIVPFIGVILYLFVGCTVYRRHAFTLKGYEDEKMAEQCKEEFDAIDADTDLEDPDIRRFARTIRNAGGWGYSANNSVELITGKRQQEDGDAFRRP